MNDDEHTAQHNEGPPQPPAEATPAAGDEAALERLQALSDEGKEAPSEASAAPSAPGRVMSSLRRSSLNRRPSMGGLTPARIAAPAVFLAAVIVVVVLLFQSGLIGGRAEVVGSPRTGLMAPVTVRHGPFPRIGCLRSDCEGLAPIDLSRRPI